MTVQGPANGRLELRQTAEGLRERFADLLVARRGQERPDATDALERARRRVTGREAEPEPQLRLGE